MDFSRTWNTTEIRLLSDASKNTKLGFGAICEQSWAAEVWPENYIQHYDPSIEYLKLWGSGSSDPLGPQIQK